MCRQRIQTCLILLALTATPASLTADERSGDRSEGSLPSAEKYSFTLKTLDGQPITVGSPTRANSDANEQAVSSSSPARATVVCFLGTECPLVKLYSVRLSQLASEFQDDNIRFIGVNSNRQDSVDDIRGYLEQHKLSFPLVRDEGNIVADAYGATRTPEIFILDANLQVVYHGRVDDQYEPGINRSAATRSDLRIAIEETLADKPVSIAQTPVSGCMIGKIKRAPLSQEKRSGETSAPEIVSANSMATKTTFCKQVIRVLQQNCIECHRTGEIGPFALDNYDDAVGWMETSLEVIDNGRMPPWGADPKVGHFANSRQMTDSDKQVLRDWVAQGMPQGDTADLPETPSYVDGWQLGREPDLILPMRNRPYEVAAEGTIEYQYFVVDPGFEEDRWISAAQFTPGNRSVVHHAIVFVRPPDGSEFRGIGLLTAYVPGQRLVPAPPGHARKVPAGSKLVFQMHYTATGFPEKDVSQLGLTFADPQDVTHEVISLIGIDQEFEIPPNTDNFDVTGRIRWWPKGSRLLAVAPHMHVRGKSFSMTSERRLQSEREGQTEPLIHVPNYDFNWQHNYVLSQPLELDDYESIHFTATFDNSKNNPFNPDPSQWVNWGDQTWEEMAVVFLEVAEPVQRVSEASEATVTNVDPVSPERTAKIQKFVDEFFSELDQDGDGIVHRNEAPLALKFRLDRFDEDGDNKVTREDVRRIAERRIR